MLTCVIEGKAVRIRRVAATLGGNTIILIRYAVDDDERVVVCNDQVVVGEGLIPRLCEIGQRLASQAAANGLILGNVHPRRAIALSQFLGYFTDYQLISPVDANHIKGLLLHTEEQILKANKATTEDIFRLVKQAQADGWRLQSSRISPTGSIYLRFTKPGHQRFVVRIADHESAHLESRDPGDRYYDVFPDSGLPLHGVAAIIGSNEEYPKDPRRLAIVRV